MEDSFIKSLLRFDLSFDSIHEIVACKSCTDEFFRSLTISPDGTKIITSSESNYACIWNINKTIISDYQFYKFHDRCQDRGEVLSLEHAFNIGDSIYDLCWYPGMCSNHVDSCCFITTSRDHPIHLWDSNSGNN